MDVSQYIFENPSGATVQLWVVGGVIRRKARQLLHLKMKWSLSFDVPEVQACYSLKRLNITASVEAYLYIIVISNEEVNISYNSIMYDLLAL